MRCVICNRMLMDNEVDTCGVCVEEILETIDTYDQDMDVDWFLPDEEPLDGDETEEDTPQEPDNPL